MMQGIVRRLIRDPLVRGDPNEGVGSLFPYAVDLNRARVGDNALDVRKN